MTDAARNDHNIFEELIDEDNAAAGVWADSAYRSAQNLQVLSNWALREHIQRKGDRGRALSAREQQGNRTQSKIRSRVEHVFGVMAMRAGRLIVRTIGIARARCKIGLRNLAYNLDRYALLRAAHGSGAGKAHRKGENGRHSAGRRSENRSRMTATAMTGSSPARWPAPARLITSTNQFLEVPQCQYAHRLVVSPMNQAADKRVVAGC